MPTNLRYNTTFAVGFNGRYSVDEQNVIVFNVDFTHWSEDPQAGYAMMRKDGSCPACATLGQVMGR